MGKGELSAQRVTGSMLPGWREIVFVYEVLNSLYFFAP